MASNLGPGVSRVLDPSGRSFREVILQQGKPPLDAEFNLLQELSTDITTKTVLAGMPSGWLGNETNLGFDYQTDPSWSNWFKFGSQRAGETQSVMWAAVNGWLIPVTGTRTGTPPGSPNDTDTTNVIALDPPPANSGDLRVDFAFLEVWQARVAPNPSAANKPSASAIYRYGNVEGGMTYLPDDLVDPALGFETSQRVQLQYRIRVVKGLLGLSSYPDGFDPSVVKAKGAYDPTHPDTATAYTFSNMRQELGDPGLWRAGDGTANNLGTVDGYVYAIPLCAIFRRNGVVWTGDPSPNLNGGFNRNPTAIDRTGVRTFSTVPTLADPLTATSTSISLVSALNIPLPASPSTPVYIQIGDEILTYGTLSGTTLGTLARGISVAGTVAEPHPAGAPIRVLPGRPDGLYADQVASTDILDLRHVVNPNGFNYDTLLRYNFDKLLRGELRSNWKRSNGGTQGVLVNYQDRISQSTASLSVTKLDGPDGYRTVWSDAATAQPLEAVLLPKSGSAPQDLNVGWDVGLTVNRTFPLTKATATFDPGDVLTVPVNQLHNGVAGSDYDQIRWVNEGEWSVRLRFDGDTNPLDPSLYTVSFVSGVVSDLTITLGPNFPSVSDRQLYVTLYVLYGPGRGVSRVADVPNSVALLSPSSTVLHTLAQFPSSNYRLSTAHAPTWSRFSSSPPDASSSGALRDKLAVTAETYVDPGSKTLILQPYRQIAWPTTFRPMDGTAANLLGGTFFATGTAGSTTANSTTFQDLAVDFNALGVTAGMALLVTEGDQRGRYTVVSVAPGGNVHQLTVERSFLTTQLSLDWQIWRADGLMPTHYRDGTAGKWATTDPLGLFSGSTDTTHPTTNNMYVSLPAHMVPHAGAVHVPILSQDATPFSEGINFMVSSGKGTSYSDSQRNYVPYPSTGTSFALLSTQNLNPPYSTAAYNTAFTYSGLTFAGIRKYTDTRGLDRKGLELPPFYGIARLWGVYEATDYRTNPSPYQPQTRERLTGSGFATNLLRQNVDGPTFWIELDEDGDSTFILNADCIDLSRSPTPIPSFESGDFVIEASIFGFDRNAFAPATAHPLGEREVRVVLVRTGTDAGLRQQAASLDSVTGRASNLSASGAILFAGPVGVLPGPLPGSNTALFSYSRTPYGGDAWGTQTNNTDISYTSGPLTSGIAAQLDTTTLDQANLAISTHTPKTFEILASLTFSTTAGTGRVGGMWSPTNPLYSTGYEDLSGWPSANPLADRPPIYTDGLENLPPGHPYMSRYNGLTERLPLGALWRDKDFRAIPFTNSPSPTVRGGLDSTLGSFAGMGSTDPSRLLSVADCSVEPGSIVVHVDGSPYNAGSPYTNFRTNRGGSGFMGSGDVPGGWFSPGIVGVGRPINPYTNVLSGMAFLVRNAPTYKGLTEVSAGGELMLMVGTQVQPSYGVSGTDLPLEVSFSSNGRGEGYAALDVYRIEGHPLVRDHVHANVDPNTIRIARR